jgi:hypothetical protein
MLFISLPGNVADKNITLKSIAMKVRVFSATGLNKSCFHLRFSPLPGTSTLSGRLELAFGLVRERKYRNFIN